MVKNSETNCSAKILYLHKVKKMKRLVVLTGAGMSAESGLRTFREMGGLWEEYDVYEVASPGGWAQDRALVLRFYNERRKQLLETKPNRGHLVLVIARKLSEKESVFFVSVFLWNSILIS